MKEEHAVKRELKVEMTEAFPTTQNCSSSLQNPSSHETSLKPELLKLSGTMEIRKHCDHSSEKRNHLLESVKGTSVENDGNCGLVEIFPVTSKKISDEKTSALVHCSYNDTYLIVFLRGENSLTNFHILSMALMVHLLQRSICFQIL